MEGSEIKRRKTEERERLRTSGTPRNIASIFFLPFFLPFSFSKFISRCSAKTIVPLFLYFSRLRWCSQNRESCRVHLHYQEIFGKLLRYRLSFFFISFSIRYHIQETAEVCTLRILFHCNHLSRKFCQEICAKILNIIETKTKAGTTFAIHESLSDYRTYAAKVYTDFYSSVITWSVLSGCQQCAFIVYNIWNLFHYKFL